MTRAWTFTEEDHLRADEKVADSMWTSLENRYREDKEWQLPETAPMLMRKQQKNPSRRRQ